MSIVAQAEVKTQAAQQGSLQWHPLCQVRDLVEYSGVVAWWQDAQVALFYIPAGPERSEARLYALDNHDPFANANVIGRGIVGDKSGEAMVASPLYKQHFRLRDGVCLEDESVKLRTWKVRIDGDRVLIGTSR
ncbi:nitrite reductase small subunit NirD [Halomonas shantousis]